MRITRIYTGDDNRTHFEELEIRLDEHERGRKTPLLDVRGIDFRETPMGDDWGLHHATNRQFVITLRGIAEVETGDGTKRRFAPGDVFFAEDLSGEGHITRQIEGDRCSVVIPVEPDFNLDALRI